MTCCCVIIWLRPGNWNFHILCINSDRRGTINNFFSAVKLKNLFIMEYTYYFTSSYTLNQYNMVSYNFFAQRYNFLFIVYIFVSRYIYISHIIIMIIWYIYGLYYLKHFFLALFHWCTKLFSGLLFFLVINHIIS